MTVADERTCRLCGRRYSTMEGQVYDSALSDNPVDLCHPFDAVSPMTCYHLWTVYGERPKVSEGVGRTQIDRAPSDAAQSDPIVYGSELRHGSAGNWPETTA